MSALLELAARCEAATGADREMDAAIAVSLNIGARGLLPDDHEYLARVRKDDGCAPGTYWFVCRSGRSLRTAEAYTASLDAAMSLVPEGHDWSLHVDNGEALAGCEPASDDGCWCADRHAATPALALCAAALRARATLSPPPSGATRTGSTDDAPVMAGARQQGGM